MNTSRDRELEKVKGNLFFKKGSAFLSRLLVDMTFEWSYEIETAAVSIDTFYWNPDCFDELCLETRITMMAHELWHKGLMHHWRMGNRCPDKWNIAGDHVINLWLEEHGYYMGGFPWYMDPKYRGWLTEAVYDDIAKPGGKPLPQGGQLLGDIIYPSPDQMTQEVMDKARADSLATNVSAFTQNQMMSEPGSIPGEVQIVIDTFLNPKIKWETQLRRWMTAVSKTERSMRRPSRRYRDPIMPGRLGSNALEHLMFFQDVSGSITDQNILRFNSELYHVKNQFQPEEMSVFTFDTKIRDRYHFDKTEPYEKIIINGRGGTCLKEVFEEITKKKPTGAIIFTDLCVDIPPNPKIPILWVVVENSGAKKPPYGDWIHVSD